MTDLCHVLQGNTFAEVCPMVHHARTAFHMRPQSDITYIALQPVPQHSRMFAGSA